MPMNLCCYSAQHILNVPEQTYMGTTTASSGPCPLNCQNVSDDSHSFKCVGVCTGVVYKGGAGQAIFNSQKIINT